MALAAQEALFPAFLLASLPTLTGTVLWEELGLGRVEFVVREEGRS